MENAVEALKQAAAVLIFVIAITVSFTMFSKAKTSADAITTAKDTQEYLEAAELAGKLYTTTESASNNDNGNATITTDGYRIVHPDDVISTIYRYNLEKYGVTLITSSGDVIARFDSSIENILKGTTLETEKIKDSKGRSTIDLLNQLVKDHITVKIDGSTIQPNVNLKELYRIVNKGNPNLNWGVPWYGNEKEIIKRINYDIEGTPYVLFPGTGAEQIYQGEGIQEKIKNKRIIEVVNEIDNSQYLKDGANETSLLQQYELPTIEVVYVIY